MLNEEMALRLLPLLQSQPYLECVTLDGTEPIDYDLDLI